MPGSIKGSVDENPIQPYSREASNSSGGISLSIRAGRGSLYTRERRRRSINIKGRAVSLRASALLASILVIITFFAPVQVFIGEADAQLPQNVRSELTSYLQKLSKGWDQEAVEGANRILSNTSYTSKAWENFFTEYFSSNPFTDHLKFYLSYAVFSWFSEDVRLNLQKGLINPMLTNIKHIMENYSKNLSDTLSSNPAILQTLFNSHGFINDYTKLGVVGDEANYKIYSFYIKLVRDYPHLLRKEITFNPNTQPYLATIRAQVWMNLRDAIPLNQSVKQEIAETIGLDGIYLDIWREFSILVIDNNGFDKRQLEVIQDVLSKIPKDLHMLGSITCNELLGNTNERFLWFSTKLSVNLFNVKVGSYIENQFPNDIEPGYSDLFTMVLIHEVNHAVDAYLYPRFKWFSTPDPSYKPRLDGLIARAGNNSMNYLRSMFESGFFVKYPQEFFASISNQYFSNSSHTLKLALSRFDKGYKEPINQFLFFANVYSQGGNTTLFYTTDTNGNVYRREVPIFRDWNGNIVAIADGKNMYRFTLDRDGNVISYSITEAPLMNVSFDIEPRVGGLIIDNIKYSADEMPVSFKWGLGSVHSIEAPKIIEIGPGLRLVFDGWSDGVTSAKRTIMVLSPAMLVAKYRVEHLREPIYMPFGS